MATEMKLLKMVTVCLDGTKSRPKELKLRQDHHPHWRERFAEPAADATPVWRPNWLRAWPRFSNKRPASIPKQWNLPSYRCNICKSHKKLVSTNL